MKSNTRSNSSRQNEIQQPNKTPHFAICIIEDAFAHTGTYLVRIPAGSIVPVQDLYHCTMLPLGARPINMYAPKSRVLVLFDSSFEFPIIMGSVPKGLSDSRLIIPESITLRSRVGIQEDPMHFSVMRDNLSALANHSAGRPIDSLPGDWGYINDFGLAFILGRMAVTMRASDAAKVEAFWGDDLVRIVGYNYELFTAGREDKLLNDEGEYNEIIRLNPFPWEALGQGKKDQELTRTESGILEPVAEFAVKEPKKDNQLIIPRQTILRGYLGDVEREIISVPPDDLEIETFDAETKHRGVLEILKSNDGTYAVRSAKAVIHEKYSIIPVPKELIAPEDPEGNSKLNGYIAAGANSQLPEFKWGGGGYPNIRSTQLYDYLAHLYGKYTTDGLVKRDKDWYYPDEREIEKPVTKTTYNKGYESLKTDFLLELPAHGELKIDHRGGKDNIRYYQSRSVIAQLDDGSIIIEDGYGSSISLKGGNIYLSCPGDVWTMPGRSAITWAPFDAIIRAGNSAELTASNKDVRIKAERNLQILSGNGSAGGMLIENKSRGTSKPSDFDKNGEGVNGHGITIKSRDSSFQVFAGDIYAGIAQDSTINSGRLTLDGGEGVVYIRGEQIFNDITSLFAVYNNANERLLGIGPSGTVISTRVDIGGDTTIAPAEGENANLRVGGSIIVSGNGLFDKGVVTNAGFAAVDGAPFVGKLDNKLDLGPTGKELGQRIQEQVESIQAIVQTISDLIDSDNATSPGNAEFQKKIGFSFRDSEDDLDLNQSTFIIFESRWQQIGEGLDTWIEPYVTAPNGELTLPHPGKKAWEEWDSFATAELVNYSINQGEAKDRDQLTEEGSILERSGLKNGYGIVKAS